MDIIMIPFHDCKKWIKEGFRTRDAHLVEHFYKDSRVDKVLVINRPVSLAEVIVKRIGWRTTDSKKTKNISVVTKGKDYQISKFNEKVYCLDTFVLEFIKVAKERKLWWFSAFQNEFVLKTIKYAVEYLGLNDIVLLLQNPMAIGIINSLEFKCFAFDAIDNWLHHPQMKSNHGIIEKNYRFIEKRADVIFAVSKALTAVFENNKAVYWIANGVDTEFFANSISIYNSTNSIKVGYVGKIQDRVNFDLIENCLKRYPEMDFVFMGPVYSQKKKIRELKKQYNNIVFTGDIHYEELPKSLKSIDIAIIPHTIDAFTESMNPLKLYEYLAAGKPVITTGVAGTNNVSEYVFTANGDDFVQLLGKVSNKVKSGEILPQCVATSIPDECRWTYRCNEILNILGQRLI